jgi:hypothetical protein
LFIADAVYAELKLEIADDRYQVRVSAAFTVAVERPLDMSAAALTAAMEFATAMSQSL